MATADEAPLRKIMRLPQEELSWILALRRYRPHPLALRDELEEVQIWNRELEEFKTWIRAEYCSKGFVEVDPIFVDIIRRRMLLESPHAVVIMY